MYEQIALLITLSSTVAFGNQTAVRVTLLTFGQIEQGNEKKNYNLFITVLIKIL